MNEPGRVRWTTVLVLCLLVLIAAAATWYRLAREGRVPAPAPWMQYAAVAALVVLLLAVVWLRRSLLRETEDAAALRRYVTNGFADKPPPRDFTRDYPLVFRPEWRGVAMNAGMTAITLMLAILQAGKLSVAMRAAALGALGVFVAGLVALLMSRKLVLSWPGVTLREIRRERFWAWDDIEAVVLWEKRGRRRPALRLRAMPDGGELVTLGGIDFANEELLFEALLYRIRKLELQVDHRRVYLTPRTSREVEEVLENLRAQEFEDELADILPEDEGADGRQEEAWTARRGRQPATPAELRTTGSRPGVR